VLVGMAADGLAEILADGVGDQRVAVAGEHRVRALVLLDALRTSGPVGALGHAEAALRHHGGELLPGVDDEWVLEARTDLYRQCAELLTVASRARLELGDRSGRGGELDR